jgi:L-ascorbate metabolism protein UlaG (beta-lactamase superfamily)
MRGSDLVKIVKELQPKTVLIHHFDRWQMPLADGMPEEIMRRPRRFAREVADIDKNIKVVIPKYFETYSLE